MIDLLTDPATTGVVVVTVAEEMPVTETLELIERLRSETDIDVASVVVNRVLPELFARGEEDDLRRPARTGRTPSARSGGRRGVRRRVGGRRAGGEPTAQPRPPPRTPSRRPTRRPAVGLPALPLPPLSRRARHQPDRRGARRRDGLRWPAGRRRPPPRSSSCAPPRRSWSPPVRAVWGRPPPRLRSGQRPPITWASRSWCSPSTPPSGSPARSGSSSSATSRHRWRRPPSPRPASTPRASCGWRCSTRSSPGTTSSVCTRRTRRPVTPSSRTRSTRTSPASSSRATTTWRWSASTRSTRRAATT